MEANDTRRGFIRKIAAAGGALLAGVAAGAAPIKRGLGGTRLMSSARKLSPSGSGLTLMGTPTVTEFTGPPTPSAWLDIGARAVNGARPASRKALLTALHKTASGRAMLSELGVQKGGEGSEGDEEFTLSLLLRAHLYRNPLAQAYANGLVLTPTGCETPEDLEVSPGRPPLSYTSHSAIASPTYLNDNKCTLVNNAVNTGHWLLTFMLHTPGRTTTMATYTLEMNLTSRQPGLIEGLRFEIGDHSIQFTPTDRGTRVGFVRLGGTADSSSPHRIICQQNMHVPGMFDFNWLSVTAF